METTLQIDTKYKLELVTSRNACRPQIENVKLDETKRFGKVAIATNGRSMAIVPVQVEGDDKGLISIEALKASRKGKHNTGLISLNGKLDLPNGVSLPRPTESEIGSYPRWEQVPPEAGAKIAFTVALDAKLLWELSQAIGADRGGVTLRFIDELSPITVTPNFSEQGELGVLMPMRVGG